MGLFRRSIRSTPREPSTSTEMCEALFTRYRRPLLAYFSRSSTGRDEAEDLTQHVFARLAKRVADGDIEITPQYVFTTAANLLHDRRRKARSEGMHAFVDSSEAEDWDLDPALIDNLEPERVLLSRERLACVLGGLELAPTRTREIFLLFRVDGMKQREIANLYGISVSAVEKHVVRALKHISSALGQYDSQWRSR